MITPDVLESWIAELAQSQGFYGRMLRDWHAMPIGMRLGYCKYLNSKGITDILDFILEVEQ